MNAKPRQHLCSGSGPHVPFWLDILKEASASPACCREVLGPKPAQCPLTSWQAGSELGLAGQGRALGSGSQAAEQAPLSQPPQVLLSSLREGRAGLGPRSSHSTHRRKPVSFSLLPPRARGCLQGPSVMRSPVQTQLILPRPRRNVCWRLK